MLVSGLSGFKGQWLGRWLEKLGANVVGFGLAPHLGPRGEAISFPASLQCEMLDIRDHAAVCQFTRAAEPDVVMHLAAQPLVRQSYSDPLGTFATNIMGLAHLLDASTQCQARVFLNVTTDKCYENRETLRHYREEDALGGYDPYSASKACSEIVTSAWRRSFSSDTGMLIATARAGNVIGGGDWSDDRLIPDIVRSIAANQSVVIRRPQAVRPWQHVLEALSGYLLITGAMLAGEADKASAWNFGPSETNSIPVGQIAQEMVAAWGAGKLEIASKLEGPHEAHLLQLDSSKAHTQLGWRALLSPQERVTWTANWYRDWLANPTRHWSLIDDQIERYDARLRSTLEQSTAKGFQHVAA